VEGAHFVNGEKESWYIEAFALQGILQVKEERKKETIHWLLKV
jgi:hypothetical protein